MKKLLNLNSFFTKIILAVLSFAVIICLFIPCAQIPAVEAVQDVDVANTKITLAMGSDVETANFISKFCAGQPYLLYSDSEMTQTVAVEKVPTPNAQNVYYMQIFLYGYDVNAEERTLGFIPIAQYTVTLTRATDGSEKTKAICNSVKKTVDITIPDEDQFDFTRVIDSRKAWAQFSNRISTAVDSSARQEVTNIAVATGKELNMNVGFTIKSEINPTSSESDGIYYAIEMYDFKIYRDSSHKTLPTVGETGLGIMSAQETKKNDGKMKLYTGDAFMFAFMIAAAVSTLGAFIIPAKVKWIEAAVSAILGAGLIVFQVLDYVMFYKPWNFNLEAGWFVLIALGVLIIATGIFDTFRCMKEYKDEQIRIYGENAFKKKAKAPKKAEE